MNISQIALNGYHQAENQMESAAGKIARQPVTATAAIVELLQAQHTAEANLAVMKTDDELARHTLEVFG